MKRYHVTWRDDGGAFNEATVNAVLLDDARDRLHIDRVGGRVLYLSDNPDKTIIVERLPDDE